MVLMMRDLLFPRRLLKHLRPSYIQYHTEMYRLCCSLFLIPRRSLCRSSIGRMETQVKDTWQLKEMKEEFCYSFSFIYINRRVDRRRADISAVIGCHIVTHRHNIIALLAEFFFIHQEVTFTNRLIFTPTLQNTVYDIVNSSTTYKCVGATNDSYASLETKLYLEDMPWKVKSSVNTIRMNNGEML